MPLSENDSNEEAADSRHTASGDFASQAEEADVSLVREFFDFLKSNKKWWLSPILIVLGLMMFLVALSMSPAAPFIYTLF